MTNTTNATRDAIRSKILGSTKAKSMICEFFGTQVEIRQPSLGEILLAEEAATKSEQAVAMVVKYCYVPGTDEKVFEDSDYEALLQLPFGEDFVRVQKAIAQLSDVNVGKALGNSETTSEDTIS